MSTPIEQALALLLQTREYEKAVSEWRKYCSKTPRRTPMQRAMRRALHARVKALRPY